MGPIAALAAPLVAPLVGQVAGGLVQGISKGIGGALGGIADTFGKIAGGLAQNVFGAIGGGLPGMLGGIAGKGLLPFPPVGMQPPGCFGPKHPGPINVNINLGGMLGQISDKIGQVGKGLDGIMGKLQDILGKLGGAKEPAGKASIADILKEIKMQPKFDLSKIAETKPGSVQLGGGGGGVSKADGGGFGEKALDGAYDKMNSLEKKLESLDPDSPTYQKDLAKIQSQMQAMTQMISMINEMRKSLHDSAMGVIRNLR